MEKTFDDQVLDYLESIEALNDQDNRDLLLRNLPKSLWRPLKRSTSDLADLNKIIRITKGRWVQGKLALAIVLENTRRLVEGTDLEGELNRLLEQIKDRPPKEEQVEVLRDPKQIIATEEEASDVLKNLKLFIAIGILTLIMICIGLGYKFFVII